VLKPQGPDPFDEVFAEPKKEEKPVEKPSFDFNFNSAAQQPV